MCLILVVFSILNGKGLVGLNYDVQVAKKMNDIEADYGVHLTSLEEDDTHRGRRLLSNYVQSDISDENSVIHSSYRTPAERSYSQFPDKHEADINRRRSFPNKDKKSRHPRPKGKHRHASGNSFDTIDGEKNSRVPSHTPHHRSASGSTRPTSKHTYRTKKSRKPGHKKTPRLVRPTGKHTSTTGKMKSHSEKLHRFTPQYTVHEEEPPLVKLKLDSVVDPPGEPSDTKPGVFHPIGKPSSEEGDESSVSELPTVAVEKPTSKPSTRCSTEKPLPKLDSAYVPTSDETVEKLGSEPNENEDMMAMKNSNYLPPDRGHSPKHYIDDV